MEKHRLEVDNHNINPPNRRDESGGEEFETQITSKCYQRRIQHSKLAPASAAIKMNPRNSNSSGRRASTQNPATAPRGQDRGRPQGSVDLTRPPSPLSLARSTPTPCFSLLCGLPPTRSQLPENHFVVPCLHSTCPLAPETEIILPGF